MIFYTFSVIGAVAVGLCIAEELPVTICKRNSPNYSNCLKLAIEESWPRFIKGLPEFDFPSLDPLSYEYGEFEFERNEIYGRVNLTNVISKGLTNINFLAVKPHFLDDGFRLEIDSNVPKLYIKGNCKAEGKVGGFQMSGKGRFNLTLENIKGTWDLIGNVINDTWTVERFHFLPSVGSMKIHFDDLFNGNEELNNLAMFFVNEYWPILYRAMLPMTSEKWDPWLADLANRLFSKVAISSEKIEEIKVERKHVRKIEMKRYGLCCGRKVKRRKLKYAPRAREVVKLSHQGILSGLLGISVIKL